MPMSRGQQANINKPLRPQPESRVESPVVSSADLRQSVIELEDLTSNPEAEIGKLKSTMSAMAAEIGQIRGENVKLIADYQKLTTEFREIKLVLAKAHAKELRAVEGRSSWLESLDLQGVFKKNQD